MLLFNLLLSLVMTTTITAIAVLSPHWLPHDASLAIGWGPPAQTVLLDLDRFVTRTRCTRPENERPVCVHDMAARNASFVDVWVEVLAKACELMGSSTHLSNKCRYDQISIDRGFQRPWMKRAFQKLVSADNWTSHDHHEAHAAMAFHASGFESAVVLVLDGGGSVNKTTQFNIYHGTKASGGVRLVEESPMNPVFWYSYHALHCLKGFAEGRIPWWLRPRADPFMRMSVKGISNQTCVNLMLNGIRQVHEVIRKDVINISRLCGQMTGEDYAASAQDAFELIVINQLEKYRSLIDQSSGLVLVGGGAYNVLLNTKLLEHFQKRTFIPTGPGDISPAIGAVWLMQPSLIPQKETERLYLGPRLFSEEAVARFAATRRVNRTNPAEVAGLLAQSKVVAVLQGRQAIGPHPLGRATIFATMSVGIRSHTYAVHEFKKHLWMPTLVCREQDAHHLFDWNHDRSLLSSPTGLLAPRLKPWIDHGPIGFNSRASGEIIQLQTVTREQNAWLYEMLDAYVGMTFFSSAVNATSSPPGFRIPALLSTPMPSIFRQSLSRAAAVLYVNVRTNRMYRKRRSRKVADYLVLDDFLLSDWSY